MVGCAHYAPQSPSITYVPDEFKPRAAQETQVAAEQQVAQTRQAQVNDEGSTRALSLGTGGAAIREDGERRQALSGQKVAAQKGKSTSNGKKGDPSQLNLPMLIKMGALHRDLGASKNPDAVDKRNASAKASDPKKAEQVRLSSNRVANRSEKNQKSPGMLNLSMLIKMGGLARFLESAEQKGNKSSPAMLNVTMLIKMGGVARGMENEKAKGPELRSIPEQVKHGGMVLPEVVQERRRRAAAMNGTNPNRMIQRDLVGGRCFGTSCDR
jgi:hypothetical protein